MTLDARAAVATVTSSLSQPDKLEHVLALYRLGKLVHASLDLARSR
jgi:hypothetical protein